MCNYPSPCDSCAELKDCRKGCQAWETRFRTIWKQFNMYPIRKYRMRGGKHKKFVYAHPDLIKKYLLRCSMHRILVLVGCQDDRDQGQIWNGVTV